MLALDAESGEPRWDYETAVPNLTLLGGTQPVIESGRVYAGFASGKVAANPRRNALARKPIAACCLQRDSLPIWKPWGVEVLPPSQNSCSRPGPWTAGWWNRSGQGPDFPGLV